MESNITTSEHLEWIGLVESNIITSEHLEWIGLVESKIRILLEDLERCQYIESAHINPTGYTHVDKELYPFTTQVIN